MFSIDCPDITFLAILEMMNFNTPFWSSIFFLWMKIIPPYLSSCSHSFFHIGWPFSLERYYNGAIDLSIGPRRWRLFMHELSRIIYPLLSSWRTTLLEEVLFLIFFDVSSLIYPIYYILLTLNLLTSAFLDAFGLLIFIYSRLKSYWWGLLYYFFYLENYLLALLSWYGDFLLKFLLSIVISWNFN